MLGAPEAAMDAEGLTLGAGMLEAVIALGRAEGIAGICPPDDGAAGAALLTAADAAIGPGPGFITAELITGVTGVCGFGIGADEPAPTTEFTGAETMAIDAEVPGAVLSCA